MALAAEMKLAMTEVYEVATFYHHFDVVKEGDAAPPAITVRVCDSIACEIAGSRELLDAVAGASRQGRAGAARALRRPLRDGAGRRRRPESRAARDDGEGRGAGAGEGGDASRRGDGTRIRISTSSAPGHIDYAAYRAGGGYELAAACIERREDARRRDRRDGRLGPARPRRRRVSRPAASGSWSRPSRRRV